jgi:hypothetical protein
VKIEIYVAHKTAEKAAEVWAVRTPDGIRYCPAVIIEGVRMRTSFEATRVPPAMLVIPDAHLSFEHGVAVVTRVVPSNEGAVCDAANGEC